MGGKWEGLDGLEGSGGQFQSCVTDSVATGWEFLETPPWLPPSATKENGKREKAASEFVSKDVNESRQNTSRRTNKQKIQNIHK